MNRPKPDFVTTMDCGERLEVYGWKVPSEPARVASAPARYFVSQYTDGPAARWNVIDRKTQEWVRRFPSEQEAKAYANKMNGSAS